MSSNSRSTRLDQFFRSKKKKCLSPSGKVGKPDKNVNACFGGSPNVKGSLDSYLAKSPDVFPSPKSISLAQAALNRGDTVKQNLFFEVKQPPASLSKTSSENVFIPQPCSSDCQHVSSSAVKGFNKGEAKTIEHVNKVHSGQVLLEANEKEFDDKIHSSSATLLSDTHDLSAGFPLKEQISSRDGSGNEELGQFANNFLAICCSGLVSKETTLLEKPLISEKLNKNKRSASPSQLAGSSIILSKKLCGIEVGYTLMERLTANPCICEEGSEDHLSNPLNAVRSSEFQGSSEGSFAGVNMSKETMNKDDDSKEQLLLQPSSKVCKDVTGHKAGISASQLMQSSESVSGMDTTNQVSYPIETETPKFLRKCNRTPENSLDHASLCTPNAAVIKSSTNKTPGWVYHSSLFSPGDEFWNEAIQFADGLVAVKADNFSEDYCESCDVKNRQDKQGDLCSAKTGSAVSVQLEVLAPQDLEFQNAVIDVLSSKSLQQSIASKQKATDTESEDLKQAVSGECMTKHGKEKWFVGRLGHLKPHGSSPLPVRHFDFSCEENIITDHNLDKLSFRDMESVSPKNHLEGPTDPCVAAGNIVKQADTCLESTFESLEKDAQNVGSKDSQNATDTEDRRMNEAADINASKRKTLKDDMCILETQTMSCSYLEPSTNKDSAILACHVSIMPSLKPVPCLQLEILRNTESSVVQNKNFEASEDRLRLVSDLHFSGNNTPEVTAMKANGTYELSTKDENLSTPSSGIDLKDRLELSSWLPQEICNVYAKKGITKLYPWQVECLQLDGVLERRNLVYCASTSAGKSLVAEILLLRRVISTGKRAILVLPYVSLCAEKTEHLEILLDPLNKRVRSFYGAQGSGTLPKDTSVAVCTIEKANSLINRLLEEGRLAEVAIIVIDELHMVGDRSRGYLLELMLTKLRYAAGEGDSGASSGDSPGMSSGKTDPALGMQIVGMSATMPNVAAVASWLQAALFETEFRPVPLDEYIKVGNAVYSKTMEVVRTIRKGADLGGKDPDHVIELCNEVVQEGHSVLLFCSSRKACETTARHVAKFLKEFSIHSKVNDLYFKDAFTAVEELRKCPAGLDPTLGETLPSGVAYHHAGLTVEEREIVETCYRQGIVRVLTATSTLAAGVNLPARRVIFRQPRIGRDFIDGTRYRQMAGRAGRAGIDTKGESILICKPEEVKRMATMLNDSCPPLQSCLAEDKNGMTRAILEVVAGGIVQTANDVHRYVRCTLLNSTQPFEEVVKSAQDSLRWLCNAKFLEWNQQTQIYTTTPLGRAAFGSSLSPEESLIVLEDLARAREGFVLASDLHVLYQVTPINVEMEPDWEIYYQRFMELCPLDQSVSNRVGVMEPFLMRMAHGAPVMPLRSKISKHGKSPKDKCSRSSASSRSNNNAPSTEQTLRVCKRFYVALMLARLVQEVPLMDVCEAFKVPRGMLQALQDSAGRFASMVSAFCERLGWHDLEGLVSKFQNRVSFGVRAEIAELTSIPFVKAARARALYKAGLRTAQAIAEASLLELVKALFEASSWAAQDGSRGVLQHRIQMGVARKIKNGARQIVLDQAEVARVAAFSAFKALGLNVPHALSQPVGASSLLVGHVQDNDAVAPDDEMTVDKSLHADASNSNVLSGVSPVLLDTNLHTAAKGAHADGIDIFNKQRGKDIESTFINGSEGALPDEKVVGTGKYLVSNNLSNEKHNERVACEDAAMICGSKVEEESSQAIREKHLVAKGNEITMDEDVSMFTGFKVDQETTYAKQDISAKETHISNKGPFDVNDISGRFDSFLKMWEVVDEFFFDLHFSDVSAQDPSLLFEIHGLAVCWRDSPVYYVNFCKGSMSTLSSDKRYLVLHEDDKTVADINREGTLFIERVDTAKERWDKVAKIMCQEGVKKVTWNLKRQIQAFKKPGISMPNTSQTKNETSEKMESVLKGKSLMSLPSLYVGEAIDICLVSWLLWPDEESTDSPTLEQEVKKRLSGEVAAAANRAGRWRNQMARVAHNGCCRRVAQIRALHSTLWKLIVSEGLDQALTSIEIPLVNVLADMENWGIGVDMEACRRARGMLECKLKELEDKAHNLSGVTFSLSNSADVAKVLYGHLKLPVPEGSNKGKQHPSTDKHALDLLRHQHPVVGVIKEHRTLAKLLHCTLSSIFSWARLFGSSQTYCIHGHWLQTSTATGRLSMEEPNLQHVEHRVDFTIGSDSGISIDADKLQQHQINARDFFVPTQESWLLMSADYSQIELRLMAHFSEDASLLGLLRKPDGDLFRMIAARWTEQNESAITEKQRDQTKKLIYGILYGMGVNTLAEHLECSVAEAAERYNRFKSAFPGVSSWLHQAVERCRQKGYIQTLSGRKRFLGKINFGNRGEQAKAERQAVNSICQVLNVSSSEFSYGDIFSILKNEIVKMATMSGFCSRYNKNGYAESAFCYCW
eukprot:Gb_33083 [translate_table: standard]